MDFLPSLALVLSLLLDVVFSQSQQSGNAMAVGFSGNGATFGQASAGLSRNSDDQDYPDNQRPAQRFGPSPFAGQFQGSTNDFMGNMMMGAPWNNPHHGMPIIGQPGPPPMNMMNRAMAILNGTGVRGVVIFTRTPGMGGISITGNVTGLPPNSRHGFHIHQYGDLSNGCTSAGAHFNPYNATHGAPTSQVRHVGDLGNVVADANGMVTFSISDSVIALDGPNNILGRAAMVHQLVDDLGAGNNNESLSTGNAGGRMACGVIGIAF